jgi:outer membrane lipoprotein SlyB
LRRLPRILPLLLLAACGADYSPDTYATRAVQQANKVEQGMVVGRREVSVTAEGSTGAATGAAAGGVLGAQTPGGGIGSALGGVGGALIGGLIGTTAEHVAGDTKAFEYVVRTTGKNELISVTQRDQTPLVVGQRVLVIAGTQARIVPDYTTEPPATPAVAAATAAAAQPQPASAAPAPAGGTAALPPAPSPPVVIPPPPAPPAEAAAEPPPQAPAQGGASQAVQNALTSQLPPVAQGVARSVAASP